MLKNKVIALLTPNFTPCLFKCAALDNHRTCCHTIVTTFLAEFCFENYRKCLFLDTLLYLVVQTLFE